MTWEMAALTWDSSMDMRGLLGELRLPRMLRDVHSDPDGAEPASLAPAGAPVGSAPLGAFSPGPLSTGDRSADTDGDFSAAMTAVTSAFGDPTRREIYLFVRANPGATASEVASRFSLHPNVARHHLERLATGGYVEVTMARSAGHGAGRPSKRFRAVANDPTLDFLTRRNDLLVLLLQEALQLLGPEAAEDDGASTSVVADNCPFGSAASQYPVLCAVDRGMISGLLAGLCGEDTEKSVPVVLSSRARGDDQCVASA